MKSTTIWLTTLVLVTALLWIPYIVERISRVGLKKAMGYGPEIDKKIAPWAIRAKAAHLNANEGLVVFFPLAILASLHPVLNPVCAIEIYLGARVVHYLSYVFAIPYLRTLAFFVLFADTLFLAVQLFQ